jgi:hypothetical protein
MGFTWAYLLFMASTFAVLRKRETTVSLPSILTAQGVLGTFLGIFLGLMDFDTENVQASVPSLLEGMRFAFLTSIAGMAGAMFIRVAPAFTGRPIAKNQGATLDSVTSLLSESIDAQRGIERALTGDGETTVLTQLQKLRTGLMDKQDELLASFRSFAETMAENNQKALIDALTDVMRDFNAKINEQFGENFKELNEAVGRMLDWQKEYAAQVETVVDQLNTAVESTKTSSEVLAAIAEDSSSFHQTAEALDVVISAMHNQTQELSARLQAFADVGEKARIALPEIESKLHSLTQASTELVGTAQRGITEQTTSLRASQDALSAELRGLVTGVTSQIERLMDQNAEAIARQVTALDQSLGDELTKALTTLGSQLASLSEKFVADYTPLTERLQEIVRISGDGRR